MKSKLTLNIGMAALLSSCHTRSPSINIVGAYFPDWLFCMAGGVLSTVVIYVYLSSQKKRVGYHLIYCPTLY